MCENQHKCLGHMIPICNVRHIPAGGNRVSSQPCLVDGGDSAHSLVINVLVMSHEEEVGGGWDR